MISIDALKSVPLFAGFSQEQLSTLANYATWRRHPRGALVLRATRLNDALYIVQSGRVKVFEANSDGGQVILSIFGRGDFFGEMALLDDLPASASVETLEPCELVRISKSDFTHLLGKNFDLTMRVMLALIGRLRRADHQIESLALMDVFGRVARVLLDLAEPIDGVYTITVAPSRLDMAYMVGASREMVFRVIKQLQTSGHILVNKRSIILLDKPRTERVIREKQRRK